MYEDWEEREALNTMCKYLLRMENTKESCWTMFQVDWRCCQKNLDSRFTNSNGPRGAESRFLWFFSISVVLNFVHVGGMEAKITSGRDLKERPGNGCRDGTALF